MASCITTRVKRFALGLMHPARLSANGTPVRRQRFFVERGRVGIRVEEALGHMTRPQDVGKRMAAVGDGAIEESRGRPSRKPNGHVADDRVAR